MKEYPWAQLSHIGREPAEKIYSIYDAPDGEKCVENCRVMLVRSSIVGSYLAVCEMIAFSKPTTPWAIAARFSSVCLPVVSMATAYPAVVCVAHQIRKKDDPWNHFIAGFVSGTILGARLKSQKYGILYGTVLGTIGLMAKTGKMAGVDWVPERHSKASMRFDHYRHSFIPGLKVRPLEAADTAEHEAQSS